MNPESVPFVALLLAFCAGGTAAALVFAPCAGGEAGGFARLFGGYRP